jgi:Protein of unknown function (DUF3142)
MTSSWLRLLLLLFPLTALAASGETHGVLPQDAYVWQRQWTPSLASAMAQSSDLVRAWRVLAAQSDAQGRLRPVAVDWTALERSERPVIPVIRIDGQLVQWDQATLLGDVEAVAARWRDAPVTVAGIEIDHDCGTARLSAYARFLGALRARLDAALPLSITALPAWLASRDFDAVLAAADEAVLQVHAVRSPRAGLFDAGLALQWTEELARRTSKPFRVALPAYGTRVSWRDDGGLLAVESETPLLAGGSTATDLIASPLDVAALLRQLERARPPHLQGIVWFRLPTADDRRAWSLATWRAVIRGEPLRGRVEALAEATGQPGLRNLVLSNPEAVDADLPQRVKLPENCALADGINGYTLASTGAGLAVERVRAGLLRGHHRQVIGWVRCTGEPRDFHVEP